MIASNAMPDLVRFILELPAPRLYGMYRTSLVDRRKVLIVALDRSHRLLITRPAEPLRNHGIARMARLVQ